GPAPTWPPIPEERWLRWKERSFSSLGFLPSYKGLPLNIYRLSPAIRKLAHHRLIRTRLSRLPVFRGPLQGRQTGRRPVGQGRACASCSRVVCEGATV